MNSWFVTQIFHFSCEYITYDVSERNSFNMDVKRDFTVIRVVLTTVHDRKT